MFCIWLYAELHGPSEKKLNHEILLQAFWSLDKGYRDTQILLLKIDIFDLRTSECLNITSEYQRTYQIKEKYKVSEILSVSISSNNKQYS